MFTLLVVLVVLYQIQLGRRTRRKKQRKNLGFQLTCEKFENKTNNNNKKRDKKMKNKHLIPYGVYTLL
jgi:hypothetical protein